MNEKNRVLSQRARDIIIWSIELRALCSTLLTRFFFQSFIRIIKRDIDIDGSIHILYLYIKSLPKTNTTNYVVKINNHTRTDTHTYMD